MVKGTFLLGVLSFFPTNIIVKLLQNYSIRSNDKIIFLLRSPSVGFVGPYLTSERPLPERKVSNNVESFVELYDQINKKDDTGSSKELSRPSKDDNGHVSKKEKKRKKKKDEHIVKEEGLEEIRIVKVFIPISKFDEEPFLFQLY